MLHLQLYEFSDYFLNNNFSKLKLKIMIGWILASAILAVLFALLGFTGIARGFAAIAKILFYIFLVIFIIVLIANLA
jgi:uncharacterized membrane protein YtjA (UPF0391 family)